MSVSIPTVIVTGGSRGIGKAISDYFLRQQYNVAVWSRTVPETSSTHYIACSCDIRSLHAIENAYDVSFSLSEKMRCPSSLSFILESQTTFWTTSLYLN
jgi:NAD(P)-dependent dehydrogenase (short-subunit alcohol dehydrogenase family)